MCFVNCGFLARPERIDGDELVRNVGLKDENKIRGVKGPL